MRKQSLKYMNNNQMVQDSVCTNKIAALENRLRGMGQAVLAFSGGVDSSFLMAVASRAGLERLVAVTVVSQFFTREEKNLARKLAAASGVEHICLDIDVLADKKIIKNTPQRCYFCKLTAFTGIRKLAGQYGIDALVHGVNIDDLGDYRPGLEAAGELGFQSPLVDAGFSKQEIRACSKKMGLETWDLPSQSCLATRIPFNEPITKEKLGKIARAEGFLRRMGLAGVRVRCHGDMARIETYPEAMEKIIKPSVRKAVSDQLKKLGFSFVALDLDGYETGRMNQDLK